MSRSLRQRRWDAFQQLDRITSKRRSLLSKWFRTAVMANRREDGSYFGMTLEESREVDKSIDDLTQFCATEGDNDHAAS